MLDGQVHGQVTAPGVPEHIRAVGPGRVKYGDRVRYVPADVERPGRDGRRQAALLVPDHLEAAAELVGQRRGVVRQARAAVQDKHRHALPGLPPGDTALRDRGLELARLDAGFSAH
jgi:hypothetical protein